MSGEPIEDTLGLKFILLAKAYRDQVGNSTRRLGLYPGQELILTRLWIKEGVSLSEFARSCGLEPPTVTKILDRMSRTKLVRVEPDPSDRRVRRVYLTDKGRALKGEVRHRWGSVEKQLLSGFNDRELKALRGTLERLRKNIGNT